MAQPYRLIGAELSPYSVKVRSYLRYKGLPHEWLLRTPENEEEFRKHARLPIIPVIVFPDGTAMQDSTPIIEALEARHPDPPLEPEDAALAFLSALIEEYADEWGNKAMFHYRWTYDADADDAARRIASMAAKTPEDVAKIKPMIEERMRGRLALVGSNKETLPIIEDSFRRTIDFLEAHLDDRPYLFGGRPCLGDLGLWCQIYELSTDPTPWSILKKGYRNTRGWIDRVLAPRAEGDFESWDGLKPTLAPFLRDEVAGCYAPWAEANARAIEAGAEAMEVEIHGRAFRQTPQKYHARSMRAVKEKYARVADDAALNAILDETGLASWLKGRA